MSDLCRLAALACDVVEDSRLPGLLRNRCLNTTHPECCCWFLCGHRAFSFLRRVRLAGHKMLGRFNPNGESSSLCSRVGDRAATQALASDKPRSSAHECDGPVGADGASVQP